MIHTYGLSRTAKLFYLFHAYNSLPKQNKSVTITRDTKVILTINYFGIIFLTKIATKYIKFNIEKVDMKLFIGEVKLHPEIWNLVENNYHDRIKKEQCGLKFVGCCVKDLTKRINRKK